MSSKVATAIAVTALVVTGSVWVAATAGLAYYTFGGKKKKKSEKAGTFASL